MTAAFPSWINQFVNQENFGEQPESNISAFQPDVGPPLTRRRSSISQDLIPCEMWLSSSDWQDLENFTRYTLLDGTQQFTWVHPRTQIAGTFKFEPGQTPALKGTIGPFNFVIQFTLRLISGGVPLPTVTACSPNNGTSDGGTLVTITGANIAFATAVTIDGVPATAITPVNANTITCITGASFTYGLGNIVVTTPTGVGTGVNLFTYTPWFAVYAIGGTNPTDYADFTTEGALNHYENAGVGYAGFSPYWTAKTGTFTRATPATNYSDLGNLVVSGNGVLRFDYSPTSIGTPLGILIEGQDTNYLPNSNSYMASMQFGTSAQNVTGPDGLANSAWTFTGAGGGSQTFNAVSGSLPASVTLSFFGKAGTSNFGQTDVGAADQYFNLTTGAPGSPPSGFSSPLAQAVSNGFFRCSVNLASTPTLAAIGGSSSGTTMAGSGTTVFYGQQVSAFPGSYIPNATAGTATRNADLLNAPYSPSSQFTKFLKFTTPPAFFGVANCVWSLAVDFHNEFVLEVQSGTLFLTVLSGGIQTAQLNMGAVTVNTTYTFAVACKANSYRGSLNGGTIVSASTGAMPVAPTTETFGCDITGSQYWFGHILREGTWDGVFATDLQLQALN